MNAEIKPLAGMERKKLRDVIPLSTPFSLYFFPTNRCNFLCYYCAHANGPAAFEKEYGLKAEDMSLETFCRAIDQAERFPEKIKTINLSGQGEPLLNVHLPEMIAYAKRKNVAERIEIITNAALLTEEKSEALIDAGLDCIRISIQGITDESYIKTCKVSPGFEKIRDRIKWFYDHKKQCGVYVKTMDVTLENGREEDFYKLFSDRCDRMYVEKCKPVYDTIETTKGLGSNTDRYGRPHKDRMVCPLPFYMLGILPDGTVSPCETIYVPEVLGNVWNSTLPEMWNGDGMRAFQKMQLEKIRMNDPKCSRCCAPNDVSHPEDDLD